MIPKTTDSGTILNFRGFAQLLQKKNFIEGTLHRLVRCTSNWKNFDEALEVNMEFG